MVNWFDEETRFHYKLLVSQFYGRTVVKIRLTGHIARPTAAQTYAPRLIVRYRGSKAVISVPADTEFAAMLVPN